MSGPAGSPDELDQALALANDALTHPPAGGPCAHCPARGGPAGGPATTDSGAVHRPSRRADDPGTSTPPGGPGGSGTAGVGRRDGSTPAETSAGQGPGHETGHEPAGGPDAHSAARAGARGPEPVEDDLAIPWLSAASPSTEGLRAAAAPGGPGPAEGPADDDLAPAWLLGSADGGSDATSGEGRLSGMMRALRRPAPGQGGADRDTPADDGPADDGLLPEWLTRAARRVGRNRPDAPDAADGTDPDDALAAPWVPRVPVRPGGPRPDPAPSPFPELRPDPAPPDASRAAPAPKGGSSGGTGEDAVPLAADAEPGHSASGPGGAPGGSGRGGAGEGFLPWEAGVGPAAGRLPSASGYPGDAGPGPAWGPGEEPGPSPARTGAGLPGGPACPHVCGEYVRADRRTTGAVGPGVPGPGVPGPDAPDPAPASGGPGRGGPPGERHDGRVTSHRAAADARPGVPADVPEPSAPAHPAPPPPPTHVTWEEAQRIAARAAAPAGAVTVPLDRAARQVLAAPVEAQADLPSFDTAAMDGWAVAGPGPWVPAGPPDGTGVLAGHAAPAPLADGCAVRIATGARMPDGATAVLRSERAELRDGRLRQSAGAPAHSDGHGTDVRPRGQECRAGDRLLPAGTPVTPPVLGLAAAAGYDRLTVTPRPRAEVLVLGDELLHSGLPSGGRIRDALGPMVGPWLGALGAEVLVTRRLGDDAEALHEAVTTTTADLVVTTGGTAHGPVDHVRPTLHRIGAQLLVDGVEVRPGHPMLLAALAGEQQGRHLVGLPGNPLAAVSGLLTLAAPLLRARAGLPEPEPVRATLTAEVQGHPRDTRLVPVTRSADGSGATPLRWTGPAMLRGIAGASALAAVPPGGAAAGTSVRLLELPW